MTVESSKHAIADDGEGWLSRYGRQSLSAGSKAHSSIQYCTAEKKHCILRAFLVDDGTND